jgi:hypothetical protein
MFRPTMWLRWQKPNAAVWDHVGKRSERVNVQANHVQFTAKGQRMKRNSERGHGHGSCW